MFKEQMNKFKSLILKKTEDGKTEDKLEGRNEKSNKKKMENLVVFLIVAIITLIAINNIMSHDEVDSKGDEDSSYKILANSNKSENSNSDRELEERLENILKTMVGVR